MLGLSGTIELHIRPRKSKTMGQANSDPADRLTVFLWPNALAQESRRCERWTVQRLWAWVLAHELAHLTQIPSWNELSKNLREDWATALEPIFGPIIENELAGCQSKEKGK